MDVKSYLDVAAGELLDAHHQLVEALSVLDAGEKTVVGAIATGFLAYGVCRLAKIGYDSAYHELLRESEAFIKSFRENRL